jgi:hypothetical protein
MMEFARGDSREMRLRKGKPPMKNRGKACQMQERFKAERVIVDASVRL